MASTLTNTQSYSALPLFAPAAKNIFANIHSQKTGPTLSLHSNSVVSHFSQSKRHPSLPPRPPVVVSTSTADEIDGLPRCSNEVAGPFNDLVPATRGMKSSDVESPVCAIVKDYSDDNHTRGSLCPTMAIAAYADLTSPSTRGQSQSPGSSAAGNQVSQRRGSHHGPIQGQSTSLSFDAIRDYSPSIPDDFDSHLSKKQSSGSITSEEPSPNNLVTLSIGDGIFDRKVAGRPPKRSRTELAGHYLERSNHELTKSPPVVPETEDLGSATEESESESESDTENGQDLGDRWEYRRIVARRIDSTGRQLAQVRWADTWVPEVELGGLKTALRRYAKERQGIQSRAKELCPNCGAKKRKYDA